MPYIWKQQVEKEVISYTRYLTFSTCYLFMKKNIQSQQGQIIKNINICLPDKTTLINWNCIFGEVKIGWMRIKGSQNLKILQERIVNHSFIKKNNFSYLLNNVFDAALTNQTQKENIQSSFKLVFFVQSPTSLPLANKSLYIRNLKYAHLTSVF